LKIGIMGGTFDPIHLGHLEMAEFCLKCFDLDKIMFLPLGDAPHKQNITAKELRIEMLRNATAYEKRFFVSTVEAERTGKTYTFDTLTELKSNSNDDFCYIIGGDTLNTLDMWYRAEDVFKLTRFLVIDRPNVDFAEKAKKAIAMGARLIFTYHQGLNISSTEIRERVKHGASVEGLVDPNTEAFIYEHGLYKN